MKLAWDLINKRQTPWDKIMTSKYRYREDIIPKVRNLSTASNAWMDISRVWGRVQQNLIWRLGNGQNVKFWKDHWIPRIHSLEDLSVSDLNETTLLQNVEEHAKDSRDWDSDKIRQYLSDDCSHLFISIKTPNISTGQDRIAWFPNIAGDFTLKSAYNNIAERDATR